MTSGVDRHLVPQRHPDGTGETLAALSLRCIGWERPFRHALELRDHAIPILLIDRKYGIDALPQAANKRLKLGRRFKKCLSIGLSLGQVCVEKLLSPLANFEVTAAFRQRDASIVKAIARTRHPLLLLSRRASLDKVQVSTGFFEKVQNQAV